MGGGHHNGWFLCFVCFKMCCYGFPIEGEMTVPNCKHGDCAVVYSWIGRVHSQSALGDMYNEILKFGVPWLCLDWGMH